jgi:hypothetical protein
MSRFKVLAPAINFYATKYDTWTKRQTEIALAIVASMGRW